MLHDACVVGITYHPDGITLAIEAQFQIAFAFNSLGFVLAWRMESIQGFHGIVNLVLMPMWFLSGAIFPLHGAARGLRHLMRLDPVTYGVSAFRQSLYAGHGVVEIDPALAWGVTAAFAVAVL